MRQKIVKNRVSIELTFEFLRNRSSIKVRPNLVVCQPSNYDCNFCVIIYNFVCVKLTVPISKHLISHFRIFCRSYRVRFTAVIELTHLNTVTKSYKTGTVGIYIYRINLGVEIFVEILFPWFELIHDWIYKLGQNIKICYVSI
jgi:hypothetical protein